MSYSMPIQIVAGSDNVITLPTFEKVYALIAWDTKAEKPPRPPNSFFLYKMWRNDISSKVALPTGRDPSTELGREWNAAAIEVKKHFEWLAKLVNEKHREIYPKYKYMPQKKKGKKSSSSLVLYTIGKESTGGFVLNPFSPAETFGSGNVPTVYGPFWLACPPGSGQRSIAQEGILLTNSVEALGNNPTFAPDPSVVSTLISQNVHVPSVEVPSQVLDSAPGNSALNFDYGPYQQLAPTEYDYYGTQAAGVDFGNTMNWNAGHHNGYQAAGDLYYNAQAGPSTHPSQVEHTNINQNAATQTFYEMMDNYPNTLY